MLLALLLAQAVPGLGQSKNGFDLSGSLVPADLILSGGPPRDGIPALVDPGFERAKDVDWLEADDRLLALEQEGTAKAYPIRILNWHEIVNDRVGGHGIAVTYCPLCGTGMAFDLEVSEGGRPLRQDGQPLELGVSGLLYNSDVLMYDRQTESLWSQIGRRAITGPLRGQQLEMIPLLHTTWGRWRKEHPDGLVLSRDTGHDRDYEVDPYMAYERSSRSMFPIAHRDDRLPEKDLVLGITRGDAAVAFPLEGLAGLPRPVRARVGEVELFVYWFPDSETAFATTLKGEPVPATIAYWFAWSAFHPSTHLWTPERASL
jgi:hypothetical protein